jgi:hypothetical protein
MHFEMDMSNLLDAFADARRTWDEMVGLQPDVVSGSSRPLKPGELIELEKRIYAHREAMDALADAITSGEDELDERGGDVPRLERH